MSSCRATSFYLAPGVMRYFRNHTLAAVLPDGTWIEITHRRDLARIRREHPAWDGTVLCGDPGGTNTLRTQLLDAPQGVERWVIDERVAEGRRPDGAQHPLHRLHNADVHAIGGVTQAVQSILPGANRTLQRAGERLLEQHSSRAAHRLSLASALQGIVPDAVIARALEKHTLLDAVGWAPVRVQRFRQHFLEATAQFPERRAMIAETLLDGSAMAMHERVAVFRSRLTVPTRILQAELEKMSGEDFTQVCFSRQFDAETLEILTGRLERHDKMLLLSQAALPREVVDACISDTRTTLQLQNSWNPGAMLTTAAGNPYAEQQLLGDVLRNKTDRGTDDQEVFSPWLTLTVETQNWLIDEITAQNDGMETLQQSSTAYAALQALGQNRYLGHGVASRLFSSALTCEAQARDGLLLTLAKRRQSDKELQMALVASGGTEVVRALVANERIHEEVRRALVTVTTDGELRTAMAQRAGLVAEDYAAIRETWNEAGQLEALQTADEAADDRREYRRYIGYTQRVVALEELARSPYDGVRREVALSRDTPQHVLQSLADDESPFVSQIADQQLFEGERRGRFSENQSPAGTHSRDADAEEWEGRAAEAERDIDEALNQLAEGSRTVRHQVERDVHAAAVIAARNVENGTTEHHTPSTVADLPGFGSLPFRGIETAQSAIDGESFTVRSNVLDQGADRQDSYKQTSEGVELRLTARVLSSAASVEQNAEYMGNCTNGYVQDVAIGDIRLVGLYDEDGRCHLNVELRLENDEWRAGEINTRFNGYGHGYENTPKRVQQIANQLAERMNNTAADDPD